MFIELPRTGSSAVSRELCEHYGGTRILKKHATYRDFLKIASGDEKSYFVFSGIRNPLDKIVSLYFKYRTDQRDYENSEIYAQSNPFITYLQKKQFRYVKYGNASFSEFFRRFYVFPFDDWSCLDHKRLDFVLHFEELGRDFAEVLKLLGIEPIRPLPVRNKTKARNEDFWSFYGPDVQQRAEWVFGPYLRRWGYVFPLDWQVSPSRFNDIALQLLNIFRIFYWRYLR